MNDRTQVAERDQKTVAPREGDQSARRRTLTPTVDVFEDSQGITLWADLPGVSLITVIPGRLPDDMAEPEFLDVAGQMLNQAQARPLRRKHRAAQILLGQAVQYSQDVLALTVQGRQKRCALAACWT